MPYLARRDPSCIKYDPYYYHSTIYTREYHHPPTIPLKSNKNTPTKPMHLKDITNLETLEMVTFFYHLQQEKKKGHVLCFLRFRALDLISYDFFWNHK